VWIGAKAKDVAPSGDTKSVCGTAAWSSSKTQLDDLEHIRGFEARERARLPCGRRRTVEDDRDRTWRGQGSRIAGLS
jgi:hypothetical protein